MSNQISETRLMWGMPITVSIVDVAAGSMFSPRLERELENFENSPLTESDTPSDRVRNLISQVFTYFEYIDNRFSTYKSNSEKSLINQGALNVEDASNDMRTVFRLAEKLRMETNGYFNITRDGKIDPSGLVKGWALSNAAEMLCA